MARHQNGYIYKKNGWWILRYRNWVSESGAPVWKQLARRLAPVCDKYRSKSAVRPLAVEVLRAVNGGVHSPDAALTIGEFVEQKYFPWIATQLRKSSVDGYLDVWRLHIKPRCSGVALRDFRPADGEKLMCDIASGNDFTRTTLAHIKHWLSGVFTYARRQGFLNEANPMQGVSLPKGRRSRKTHAYSLEEICRVLPELPLQAKAVVACAAFAGLSHSELRGLLWENWREGQVFVTQALSNGIVTETKNEYRQAGVPVIPYLAAILTELKLACGRPQASYMFAGRKGQPLNLYNLADRIVKPAMRTVGVGWCGWHAFRRGLATNLKRLGVDDQFIQRILRHGDAGTTRRFYIKEIPEEVMLAMGAMERELCTTVHRIEEEARQRSIVN